MKFSYNWIREFVEDLNQAPGPLGRLITMKTAECEGIETAGALLERACAARILSVEPIEDTHNVRAVVDAGRYGERTVVCGAKNCRPGVITAYAPIGKKVIHGVESDGMLASAAELGINRDHSGIVELDSQVGAPLPGCLADSIIEIDNKSITHRPDLWGHHGMAREVAAILGLTLKDPAKLSLLPSGPPAVQVKVEDWNLCPRYSALVFENLTIQPSPLWLQCRLTAIGLNPINNVVDMTNYVMAELAQPMHAFDADLVKGDTIFIRSAMPGEHFEALNDESYTLDPSNLVIADAAGAIGLAGVIGGAGSRIGPSTTRVILESANFQAASIRRTSAAIKLRTDASMRFEKAQDPCNTVRGLARAIELLREVSPGIRVVGGIADVKREIPVPAPIQLPLKWLERKLGRAIEAGEVRRILKSLEFGVVESAPSVFSVSVPSWRATKDISIKDDLVEEVGRMVGYDSITPEAPLVAASVPPGNPERRFQHEVRNIFVDLGFTEVYNYSFIGEESAMAFALDPAQHVRVANPVASDQALMRLSLLPGIWRNVLENAKYRESFRLFEIGVEIHRREALPDEVPHLVAAIYGRQSEGAEDNRGRQGAASLLELKHAAGCLMLGAAAEPAKPAVYEHPTRSAAIHWKGQPVGRLFELHPRLVEIGRAAILDLDLRLIQSLSAADTKYKPIRRYPSSAFDLSVVAGRREYAGHLESRLASFAGPLLDSIEFLREYEGPQVGEGKKSVSYRLTVSSTDRTLASEEVSDIRAKIIDGMRGLGYELRV